MIRKSTSMLRPERIPVELKDRNQWLCWLVNSNGNKTPINARTGKAGKSNDPRTWTDFQTASRRFGDDDRLAGVAFVISDDDPYCGVDLDSCRNIANGEIAEWARAIINGLNSYTETSPGRAGVKIIIRATKPPGSRCLFKIDASPTVKDKTSQVEIYDRLRFWTITSDSLDIYPLAIFDRQVQLTELISSLNVVDGLISSETPNSLLGGSNDRERLRQAVNSYVSAVDPVDQGRRDNAAFSLAGNLAAFVTDTGMRLSESEIVEHMTFWNARNRPPLSNKEILAKVSSAMRNGTPRADKVVKTRSHRSPKIRLPETSKQIHELTSESGRTDAANAARFAHGFGDRLLYVPKWKKWLAWDSRRWLDDGGIGAQQLAKHYAEDLWPKLGQLAKTLSRDDLGTLQSFVKSTNQRKRIWDLLELAKSDARIVCEVDCLNRNPTLLNVENGTVDLESGELRPHRPEDRLTQIATVRFNAQAQCPRWIAAMNLIFDDDPDLIQYVQSLLGYSVAGLTSEHILPICWGKGCNGKSTIWNTICYLLGDYAKTASQSLLMSLRGQHPTAICDLYQRRFVPVTEPSQDQLLNEALVKELTGGDLISARRMNEDFWTFEPTHTFWLSTNHKPRIRGTDEGIWRRIKLIPCTVDIQTRAKVQKDFAKWLAANEGPGILNWLIAGFLYWQRNGFVEPAAVKLATIEYRATEDELGQWINEHCELLDGAETQASMLYERYKATAGSMSQTEFGSEMVKRFERCTVTFGPTRGRKAYRGVRLIADA